MHLEKKSRCVESKMSVPLQQRVGFVGHKMGHMVIIAMGM
jgi:hypothetical protein